MSELRWILLGFGVLLLGGIVLWGRRSRGQAANFSDHSSHTRVDPPMAQRSGTAEIDEGEPTAAPTDAVASRWDEEDWINTVADLPEIRMDADQPFYGAMGGANADDEEDILAPPDLGVATEPNLDDPLAVRHATRDAPVPVKVAAAREQKAQPKQTDKRKIITLRLFAIQPNRYAGSQLRSALESMGLRHGRYGIFHRLDGNGSSIISIASMVEPGAFDLATMADAPFAGVTLFAMLPGPLSGSEMCDQIFDCARQLEAVLGGALHDEHGAQLTDQRIDAIRDEVLDFEHLLGAGAQQP